MYLPLSLTYQGLAPFWMYIFRKFSFMSEVLPKILSKDIYSLITFFQHRNFVVSFLLGNSPASEFYMPTLRNTVFSIFIVGVNRNNKQDETPYISCSKRLRRWNRESVPKRRHIKFIRLGIIQKKAYNLQNKAKV